VVNHRVASELARARAVLTCVEAENLAAYDASCEWRARGARSCVTRTAYEHRAPTTDVRRRLRRGRALRDMPVTRGALAAGRISARHADRLARARRPEVADAFAHDEAGLVREATRRPWAEWERLVGRWESIVDPDQAEEDADDQASRRELHASSTIDGLGRLDGWLDPLGHAEFGTELDRIDQALFADDWRQARREHGEGATRDHLARTPAQRRADALVEMARRSATVDRPASSSFVVNVHVDQATFLEALARLAGVDPDAATDLPDRLPGGPLRAAQGRFCETADGAPLAPTDMVLAALGGRVRRVLYDPVGRLVDHGRARRLFTGALRDAVIARSRTCSAPDCEVPAHRGEIDHRLPWLAGGLTNADNGQPTCDRDNRFKHRHPDLWRRLVEYDDERRRGSGTSDDQRRAPPREPPVDD
jgi:hypothetical protein